MFSTLFSIQIQNTTSYQLPWKNLLQHKQVNTLRLQVNSVIESARYILRLCRVSVENWFLFKASIKPIIFTYYLNASGVLKCVSKVGSLTASLTAFFDWKTRNMWWIKMILATKFLKSNLERQERCLKLVRQTWDQKKWQLAHIRQVLCCQIMTLATLLLKKTTASTIFIYVDLVELWK